jgi:ornithine decarboxylase
MDHHVKLVGKKIEEKLASGDDDAFYLLDVEDVRMKYRKWVEKIPKVVPYYAVKCNDNQSIVKALAEAGAGFDCASKKELEQILSLGVAPEKIVYSHTAKQVSHLQFAADKNVRKVTFDSENELKKIQKIHPNAEVVLRIRFDAENSIICLGVKFGCDPSTEAPALIQLCKDMKMNLIGISFHVGSGTQDYDIFERALTKVHELFGVAKEIGFNLNFVDIGGGFMGHDVTLLDHYAAPINAAVDKYFGDSVSVISEPGRYFVESALTLAAQVILKRETSDGMLHYYLNEGIYMSFLISYIYEDNLKFEIIRKTPKPNPTERMAIIWGSSCNSKDKIIDSRLIPDLEMGDWLVFRNMGAYTTTVSTNFNGFKIGKTFTT